MYGLLDTKRVCLSGLRNSSQPFDALFLSPEAKSQALVKRVLQRQCPYEWHETEERMEGNQGVEDSRRTHLFLCIILLPILHLQQALPTIIVYAPRFARETLLSVPPTLSLTLIES